MSSPVKYRPRSRSGATRLVSDIRTRETNMDKAIHVNDNSSIFFLEYELTVTPSVNEHLNESSHTEIFKFIHDPEPPTDITTR